MTRLRWLVAEWPVPISMLAAKIKGSRFTPDNRNGFVVDSVRDDLVEARYVQRLDVTETVVDPFGNERSFDRVEYRQTYFRASAQWPGLELLNPPRSAQDLLNELSELLDFSVVIYPVAVDVLAWADAFQNMTGIASVVDSLQIGSLELDTGVTAKAVIKGDKDVRAAATSVTGGRKFAMEKMQLRLQRPGLGTAVLTTAGTVKLSSDAALDFLRSALRESLATVCQPIKAG